jgi:cell fate (sporulation/competence/biofilm development) regulator YlbF (YheA/YmcA/DUF963 family)
MFDEEYNDYEEYENFDNSQEIVEAAERAREAMIVKAIKENYEKLTQKGFSQSNVEQWSIEEISQLLDTVTYMIEYFEGEEEYEKCAVLVSAQNALLNEEAFAPIA